MPILAQTHNMAEPTGDVNGIWLVLIPLVISTGITALLWKLGVIDRMVKTQNERQKRMMGRSNLHGAEWGTGRSAAVSFTAAIWFITLGVSFIALILWT